MRLCGAGKNPLNLWAIALNAILKKANKKGLSNILKALFRISKQPILNRMLRIETILA
ncbi:hypothetical protein D3C84_134650 [compost metagenome]